MLKNELCLTVKCWNFVMAFQTGQSPNHTVQFLGKPRVGSLLVLGANSFTGS